RVSRRLDVVRTEMGRTTEETHAAEQRRDDASAAIVSHEDQHRDAEVRLDGVLASWQRGREAADQALARVTEARTEKAALGERTSALDGDVARLEDVLADLMARLESRRADIERTLARVSELRAGIAENETKVDAGVRALDELRGTLRDLDDRVVSLRA